MNKIKILLLLVITVIIVSACGTATPIDGNENEPSNELPVVEDPIIDDPVVDDPIIDDPVVDDPIIDQPFVLEDNIVVRHGCAFLQDPSVPTESVLRQLAQYRWVVLDIELIDNPLVVGRLRELNPGIKIVVYVNPQDLFVYNYSFTRPWQTGLVTFLLTNYDDPATGNSFFVYDRFHINKQRYWLNPPMHLMNLSTYCPRIGGKNYSEFIAEEIIIKIFYDNPCANEIDFVLVDNAIRDYAWMSNESWISSLDANWNGVNDFSEQGPNPFTSHLNVAWRDGINYIITEIKNASPVMVIGNQPNDYFPLLDGKQFEGIASGLPGPAGYNNGSLTSNPADALEILEQFLLPKGFSYNIIQAETFSQPSLELAETAIVIAMMSDNNVVTFRFNSTWVPDIALIEPGNPLGGAYTYGVFRIREFQNCWIVFNTSNTNSRINLSGNYYSIPATTGKVIEK